MTQATYKASNEKTNSECYELNITRKLQNQSPMRKNFVDFRKICSRFTCANFCHLEWPEQTGIFFIVSPINLVDQNRAICSRSGAQFTCSPILSEGNGVGMRCGDYKLKKGLQITLSEVYYRTLLGLNVKHNQLPWVKLLSNDRRTGWLCYGYLKQREASLRESMPGL